LNPSELFNALMSSSGGLGSSSGLGMSAGDLEVEDSGTLLFRSGGIPQPDGTHLPQNDKYVFVSLPHLIASLI
jgi:hypothetical protein